jgi:isoleucyl-tRNA synthetase
MNNPCEDEFKTMEKWGVRNHPSGDDYKYLDGPPFANGKLHMGHALVGAIKSTHLNFIEMSDMKLENKIGFDCHGLPTETASMKELGIKSIHDITPELFISTCKDLVNNCELNWKPVYQRMGRFCDFSNSYKTMNIEFMESCWWVFSELWKKGLVYQGNRILAYSSKCETPLSNFEAKENYQTVSCKSIYVSFKLIETDINIVVWTTTPWTLPSNQALCVNDKTEYTIIEISDKKYCLHEASIHKVFGKKEYKIIGKINGTDLKNKEYNPLFNSISKKNKEYKFKIISDDFVDTKPNEKGEITGTGIVHIAPSFGEDDFRVCIENEIIDKEGVNAFLPINEKGYFTDEVEELDGLYFSDSECEITVIKYLKEHGNYLQTYSFMHEYPYCYRTNTPLMYRKCKSYFVKVSNLVDRMVELNKKIKWQPEKVGNGRFHEWISNAKDWSITRNRIFGTPIPVWIHEDESIDETIVISSIDELKKLSGVESIDDLHLDVIDKIKIPSKDGKSFLKRIPDIFDCWFESGSAFIAQDHYPFSKKEFKPTDFICEGIDQTRGWFYTLLVISTALFDEIPFKNVVCGGLILDSKGEKMSKSKGNIIDPMIMINKYGADSLRLYLVASPASRAEPFKFDEKELHDVLRKLGPLMNSYNFYSMQLEFYLKRTDKKINDIDLNFKIKDVDNIFDKWIYSRTLLFSQTISNMYMTCDFSKLEESIFTYVDEMTNIYLKISRPKMQGKEGNESIIKTLIILREVLRIVTISIAPLMPFMAQKYYELLNNIDSNVFNERFLQFNYDIIDMTLINNMKYFIQSMVLVRNMRITSKKHTSVKIPIKKVIIGGFNDKVLDFIKENQEQLETELNVLNFEFQNMSGKMDYKIKPDMKKIGKSLGKYFKEFNEYIENIETLKTIVENKYIEFNDKKYIENEDYELIPVMNNEYKEYSVLISDNLITMVDFTYDDEIKYMSQCREIFSQIQKTRKELGLKPFNIIKIFIKCSLIKKSIFEKSEYLNKLDENIIVYVDEEYDDYDKKLIMTEDVFEENIIVYIKKTD